MGLKLSSLFGWFTMIAVAWTISYNRKNFPWSVVVRGIGQIPSECIGLNEFVGYLDLTTSAAQLNLTPRSFTIVTEALCGFANFSSIAIQVGGIGSPVPERRSAMAKPGFHAIVGAPAGNLYDRVSGRIFTVNIFE